MDVEGKRRVPGPGGIDDRTPITNYIPALPQVPSIERGRLGRASAALGGAQLYRSPSVGSFFAARRAGMRLASRLTTTVVMMMKARSSMRNFTGMWSR